VQDYKIANFERSNPSQSFPAFRRVGREESREFAERIAERLRLPPPIDSLKLVRRIQSCLKPVPGVSPLADEFKLSQLFWQLQIPAPESVFVNWYRFDDVDEFQFADLESHFSDVWYPSSDDIELFDASLKWLIAVSHDGAVSVCRT